MMEPKKYLKHIRGWFPKEPILAHMPQASKPRWRKPTWIALALVSIVGMIFAAYLGVLTYMRYSNPQTDVTASYFEKSLNCSTASVGDIVEIKVLVGWHGYAFPEFKRQVKIVDPYPESNFKLVSGSNTYEYSGFGGGDQFTYLLEVIKESAVLIELPKPRLYLNNAEISLQGADLTLKIL